MKKSFLSLILVITMLLTMTLPLITTAGTNVTINQINFDLNGGTTKASKTQLQYVFWSDDENPFSVVFSSASGYDSIIEALFAGTVKSGYRLAGFKCADNNKTYTSLSDLRESGDSFSAGTNMQTRTFTAVWEELSGTEKTYTVTIKTGKGGLGAGVKLTKYHGQDLNLYTTKAAIKTAYKVYPGNGAEGYGAQRELIEWNTAYNATTGKGTGTAYRDVYTADADVTLYAIWGYNIQYNADGGIFPATGNSIFLKYVCDSDNTNYQNPMTLYGNFDIPIGANAPVKEGCRRATMSNGTEFYGLLYANMGFFTTETAAQNLTIPPTGHKLPWSTFHTTTTTTGYTAIEFYAIWEPSVTYKANGGSGKEYSEYLEWDWDPLHYYLPYSVDSCSFTKAGTKFVGWNTKADGSGISYSVGANLGGQRENSDPIVLYAQWADGSYEHTCSYTEEITKEATCKENGIKTFSCSCGKSYTEFIPAAEHNYSAEVIAPDCTEKGYTKYTCSACGTSYTDNEVNALGHHFGDWNTVTEPTVTENGLQIRECSVCGETETKILPKLEVEGEISLYSDNYDIIIKNAENISYIRYALGNYNTASEIKNAQGCVTLNESKIASFTENGVCTLTMNDGGNYSLWIKTVEGEEFIFHPDLSYMYQSVTSNGATLTVHDLYGVKDFFIAPGNYDNYSDIKANYIFNVTSSKINKAHDYSYIVPAAGIYTVYIRYDDAGRSATVLKVNCTVTEPEFKVNGLQLTVSNLDDVKVIRTAYGNYSTPGEIKRAEGQRSFSAATIKKQGGENYTIQFRENGTVTIAVVYTHGYEVIYSYEVAKKVPTVVQNDNTVTFGALNGLNLIRYAKGEYTTSSQIKNAEGSKVIKAEAMVNGYITVELEVGTYTFCVQYYDESYNYYTVTVEEKAEEPEVPEITGKDWKITFDPAGGTMPAGAKLVYGINYGENYLAATGIGYPIPTKAGYTFDGWIWREVNYYLTSGDWNSGWYAVKQNIVLEAVWSKA